MTAENVRQVFAKYIVDDVELRMPNNFTNDVDFFAMIFASVPDTPTAEEMHAVDGGTRGYSDFIEQAKADGLIN